MHGVSGPFGATELVVGELVVGEGVVTGGVCIVGVGGAGAVGALGTPLLTPASTGSGAGSIRVVCAASGTEMNNKNAAAMHRGDFVGFKRLSVIPVPQMMAIMSRLDSFFAVCTMNGATNRVDAAPNCNK